MRKAGRKLRKGKPPTAPKARRKRPMNQQRETTQNPALKEAQTPTSAPEKEEVRASQGPIISGPHPAIPSPSKEPISLGSETGADSSEEGDIEVNSPSGTPDQPKRGRKPEKKRREEQSYKDVVQGSQHIIPEMMNTRSGMKIGKTPKGGHPPQPGK